MIDHDRLFKELLTTFFIEFLELFVPDVPAYLDRESLAFLDKELFTDVTSGDRYEADLVARAQVRGQESFFLIHLEHQAQPQATFGQRMFRYFARLYEQHNLPVYPIVLFSYDTPQRTEPTVHRVAFPSWTVLEFHYRVIQLQQYDWQVFQGTPNPVASALMAKMRMQPAERPIVKVEALRLLAALGLDAARQQLISGFVDTYLPLNLEEEQVFYKQLEQIQPREEEQVMEIVTSWMRQGIEQGREEGRAEGREQGMTDLIIMQLMQRFGPLAEADTARIRRLSGAQLQQLGMQVLQFAGPADLTAWLQAQPPRVPAE
ncbi:MAG: DUF4351 domain-containing protein [Chloroflexaceae bacterium]|nr:DUF4351 domain-containing protein [Chloroflexaceae bacterium]